MYKIVLINHFKRMRQAAQEQGAKCSLDVENFYLTLEKDGRCVTLEPQFFIKGKNGLCFTPTFGPDVMNFVGWLPYFNKRWLQGYDKTAFKQFVQSSGHRTPECWEVVNEPLTDVLRKTSRSSLGAGISGPFKSISPDSPESALRSGEYFEKFIFGRICKVWFWNGKAVAAEFRPTPSVEGDGVRSVRQLVSAQVDPFNREINWHSVHSTLSYQGRTSAYVPAAGERLVVDYQYASRLTDLKFDNDNLLQAQVAPQIAEQMSKIGESLWSNIPDDIRQNILFSVDGMVDDEDQIWWLEANCNPLVHPDAYPEMIASVLNSQQFATEAPVMQVSTYPVQ